MTRRVFVIGADGQDGRLLREDVLAAGHVFAGIDRTSDVDVLDAGSIARALADFAPDELHYLAAHHHSSEAAPEPPSVLYAKSFAAHVTGLVNVLEALLAHAPACRTFYAASSHVFAGSGTETQNEETPFAPVDAYGITKVAGVHVCRAYRPRGLHVSVGYLYNHESRYRGRGFVSSRIVDGALAARAAADRGERYVLKLGHLASVVDWGYAPDYVRAMRLLAGAPETTSPAPPASGTSGSRVPDRGGDYVVASGVPHTVEDFAREAFRAVGLDFRAHVEEDAALLQKRPGRLVGDADKLRRETGWSPSVSFAEMVHTLVKERLP